MVSARGMSEYRFRKMFKGLFYESHEAIRVGTVDDAVVERQRKISAGSDRHRILAVIAGHHFDALLQPADTQDSHLRLVDDRRAYHRSEDARVRDRERAILDFARIEALAPGAIREVVERSRKAGQRQVIRV